MSNALGLLPPAAIVGLSKMVGTSTKAYKDARAELVSGSAHNGQATITFNYDLSVGQEEEYVPTIKIGQLPVMALALQKAGFMGPQIIQYITEAAMEIANNNGSLDDALKNNVSEIEDAIEQVKATLAQDLPKRARDGKVLGKAEVIGVMIENGNSAS